MKNRRLKLFGAAILGSMLCLLLCIQGIGMDLYDINIDFEDESYVDGERPEIEDFKVIDKIEDGGSILIRQEISSDQPNKYLEIKKTKIQDQDSNDVYIQSSKSYDLTKRTQIRFKIRTQSKNGNINLSLRDDNSSAGQGTVNLLTINSSGKVSYGSEYSGATSETCSLAQWTEFMVEIDVAADKINIYRGDSETPKAILTGLQTNTDKLKGYNYAKCYLRFQEYGGGSTGAVTTFELDDISLLVNESTDNRFVVADKRLYKSVLGEQQEISSLKEGSLTATVNVNNASAASQKVRLAAAVYDADGRMTGVFFSDAKSLAAEETATMSVSVQTDSLEKGDKMKVFLFDGSDMLLPITAAKTYEQGKYSQPFGAEILQDLKEQNPNNAHPRLMMTRDKLAFLKTVCKTEEPYKSWYEVVKRDTDKLVGSNALPSYDDSDDLRLDSASTAAGRMMKLAFVYSIEETDRDKYMDQLVKEINHYANWPDWNPKHFLDTAAMIRGAALAYDWCYDYWQKPENAAQKEVLVDAIVNMGLVQAQKAFNGTATVSDWWTNTDNNWSIVCNGGVALGALALGDEEEYADLCEYLLEKGLRAIERCIAHFAPDGAWYEGPGYWNYTVQYFAMYMSALQTATGTDYGYLSSEGIDKTAHFPIGVTGRVNTVNLHDSGESSLSPPELFYLAAQFGDETAAKYRYYQLETQNKTPTLKDILWFDASLIGDGSLDGMQLDFAFRDIELMTFRNEYFSDNVYFAALHGGKNGINHGQIDAGSFVYEANGVRWAVDLGNDNYNLSNYFTTANKEKSRWAYYRNRGEGHNTIIINPSTDVTQPADQPLDTKATISAYTPGEEVGAGEIDMQPMFGQYTNSATRSIELDKISGQCTITDRISFKDGTENNLYWFMHTKASNIELKDNGKTAVLTQSNKKLYVYITEGDATFEVKDAVPLEGSPNPNYWPENGYNETTGTFGKTQNRNSNFKKLQIHLPEASGELNLQVVLSPTEL